MVQTKEQALANRMIAFEGGYDGGYSTSGLDDALIQEAIEEANAPTERDLQTTEMGYLCYVASEYAKTHEQYHNAKAFILAYVDSCWDINMCEGGNAIYSEIEIEG